MAAELLDGGGEEAVTLRAVGQAAGLSHNAPYKHFDSRSALLAAVATQTFGDLVAGSAAIRASAEPPAHKLSNLIGMLIAFRRRQPFRYRLLFNNSDTAAAGGALQARAMETFEQFRAIVAECQAAGDLPDTPSQALASLIFASAHGLLAIESEGAMRPEKGLSSVGASMVLLLQLLSPDKSAGKWRID